MTANVDQVMEIVRRNLDATTAGIIKSALADASRISVIRDMFLEGRDVEAVQAIRELDPLRIRKVLGASSRDIAIEENQTAQITVRPQLPFTPSRFLVAKSCASSFLIVDIRVANRCQFIQTGSIAAELFAADAPVFDAQADADGFIGLTINATVEGALGLPIDIPEVLPGQEITLVVTCTDGGLSGMGRVFEGAFLGTTRSH